MAVESKSRLNSRVLSPLMDKRKTHHHRLLVLSFRASFAAQVYFLSAGNRCEFLQITWALTDRATRARVFASKSLLPPPPSPLKTCVRGGSSHVKRISCLHTQVAAFMDSFLNFPYCQCVCHSSSSSSSSSGDTHTPLQCRQSAQSWRNRKSSSSYITTDELNACCALSLLNTQSCGSSFCGGNSDEAQRFDGFVLLVWFFSRRQTEASNHPLCVCCTDFT